MTRSEMLAHSIAIMFCYHNFVRVHQAIGTTPVIAAGIAKHKWRVEDMVDLLLKLIYNTRPRKDSSGD
jgi:hypothetical protein